MQQEYTPVLFDLLQRRGVELAPLLRDQNLSRAHQLGEVALSRAQFNKLIEHAAVSCSYPELALEFGSRLNVGSHGVLGYALMSSATVNDALRLFLHYYKVLIPEAEIQIEERQDQLRLNCQVPGVVLGVERYLLEALFASFHATSRFIVGRPLLGAELNLQYSKPDYVQAYRDVFDFPVHFCADSTYLSLDRQALDWPLEAHQPAASRLFREQCDALLAPILDQSIIANRVRQLLLARQGELPGLEAVSQHLHMSVRTLKRKLQLENTSFRKLSDQVRAQLAGQYLENTALTVADIGTLVGFDDVSNFRSAFRRWFNTTPQSYRSAINAVE